MPIEPPESPWVFPDPAAAQKRPGPGSRGSRDDDVVAVGADLEPGTLLAAYRAGLFPMAADDPHIPMLWWSPERRGILPLDRLMVSRSLRQSARTMQIRVDTAFEEVIAACAEPARGPGWIDAGIIEAYVRLHRLGWAHSVETWRDGRLVGGLYGVASGGLFAGESMFHRVRDASKVALMGLVDLLRDEHADDRLLDVQWQTEHLETLGVIEVSRLDYLGLLRRSLAVPLPAAFA